MIKIDRVLVPTDFSPSAMEAVRYASNLAATFSAELHLLHVMDHAFDYSGYGLSPEVILEMQQQLRSTVDEQMALAEKELGEGVVVKQHDAEGVAWRHIVDLATELDIDVIVMGTRGNTGLKHFWLGSTAERVVREAPCPVLTVRCRDEKEEAES